MSRETRLLVGYVAAVWAVSALVSSGTVSTSTLAASPHAVAHGRLWLLLTSGLVVDHPVVVSLLSLTAFALVTAAVCGARTTVLAGLCGHILSTVLVYVAIALMRLGQPYAFGGALRRADYGVSAVCASWLGATAATLWVSRSPRARPLILAACAAVTAFAYTLHPDHSIIASEHVFAFGVGVMLAAPQLRRAAIRAVGTRVVGPWRAAGLDPVLGLVVGATFVVGAVAVSPTAFGTVTSLLADRPASVSRCLAAWNRSWSAPRGRVGRERPAYARVALADRRTHGRRFRDCSIVFYGGRGTIAVRGHWSHGRVSGWHSRHELRPPKPPANARVVHAAGVRLAAVPAATHR